MLSAEPIPRVHQVDIELGLNETYAIRCLSDMHLDESLCDFSRLQAIAKQDKERFGDKVSAVAIGDVANLVLPPDQKRYRPSVQPRDLRGLDDWLDATIEYNADRLKSLGYHWDLFGIGNHEEEIRKRYGVDVLQHLAYRLGARRGGYSGVIDYRIHRPNTPGYFTFRALYHHGAWGGKWAKGYLGAWSWAAQHDDWHTMLYGHCHAGRVDTEVRCRVANGELRTRRVYLVNCMSWVRSYSDDARTVHYGERAGYMRQPQHAPLIVLTLTRKGGAKTRHWDLDYHVEV